jgi:hypothetical protein
LRLRPRLDQRVLPSLLPMRTLLVRGGSAIVPECIEAVEAASRFDLSVTHRLPATGKVLSAGGRRGAAAWRSKGFGRGCLHYQLPAESRRSGG